MNPVPPELMRRLADDLEACIVTLEEVPEHSKNNPAPKVVTKKLYFECYHDLVSCTVGWFTHLVGAWQDADGYLVISGIER